mgnify:CR=1 FL=1
MVPPKRVRETASRATHPSTRVLEFSRAEGYSVDYGHLDLLLGRDAPCEVFPEIASWLSQDVRLESVSSLN